MKRILEREPPFWGFAKFDVLASGLRLKQVSANFHKSNLETLDKKRKKVYIVISTHMRRVLIKEVNFVDDRKKQVLHAIIQDYIVSAEPVGSRAVAKKYDLGVSPATIRNEMSDLEELGYIEQPHTSAGRIPSDKGYRYYVDNLMAKEALSRAEMQVVRQAMAVQMTEMDEFMRACCSLISRLTNYPTMISTPGASRGLLKKLQLVSVNERQVLVVLTSGSGLVRHKLLNTQEALSPELLQRIEALAQARLVGTELAQLSYEYIRQVFAEIEQRQRMLDEASDFLRQVLFSGQEHKVYTGGALNMLSQPEFRDPEQLKNIFALLEEDGKVQELLQSGDEERPGVVSVSIGTELPQQDVQNCSLVVAHYYINGQEAGNIGVLGPTRMSYPKTVSLLEFIAKEISEALSRYNG